jgi:hypothetical protein
MPLPGSEDCPEDDAILANTGFTAKFDRIVAEVLEAKTDQALSTCGNLRLPDGS